MLITGETGTGKELVARAIHRRSARGSRAFVSVNCAAVPRELIASELFGHEKGAFTGATQRRLGRFELAHGGTIFLDEVGELPMETQVALLRVLQEREFERVGGTASVRVDVRVIAATNRDLQAAIEAGTFRSDLFYRLNVFPIAVPALRERTDDIPLLVEYFIDRYARKAGKTIRRVNKRTLDHLRSYPWPGNVRELQNVIERSVIVCDTDEFTVDESWLSARPAIEGPTRVVRHARRSREGDHRRRAAGERRTGLRPIRGGGTARHSALDARIENPCVEDQQDTAFEPVARSRSRLDSVVQHFTNWRDSPVSRSSPSYLDSAFCAGPAIALLVRRRGPMLKIQRKANGDVVLTLSGRLDADNVSELSALLAAEPAGRAVVLDLKDVVLVDRDTVRFLRARERDGIALRNCPPYIREWIAREEDQP